MTLPPSAGVPSCRYATAYPPHPALVLAAATLLALLGTGRAQAQETRQLPLWELGLGVGAVTVPNYPGSDQTQNYVLPLPYVIYRGEIFKADKDGVRAAYTATPRVEFDLSLGATPPVASEESDARRGMPNLPPALEIGPELRVHLARDSDNEEQRRYEWNLHIPVRRSVTVRNGHFEQIGNVAYPHVNWKQKFHWLSRDWLLDSDLGAYYNSRSYHQFFYQVLPQYATRTRPAYEAAGGYGGWEGTVFSSCRFERLRLAGFVQVGSIGGAAFEDSPLVRRSFVLSAGLVVNYVFWVSSQNAAGSTAP